MFTVYIILNKRDGKVYVGQSGKWKRRINTHLWKLRNGCHWNSHLQGAWSKDGEAAFDWFTIDEAETQGEIYDLEELYVSWFKPLGLCYNFTDGGEGCKGFKMPAEAVERSAAKQRGRKWTDEQKEKLKGPRPSLQGRKFKPETLEKMAAAKRGRKLPAEQVEKLKAALAKREFTPEYRAKLSEANKGNQNFLGRKHSEETIEKMRNRVFTEEHRRKIAEGQKARWARRTP